MKRSISAAGARRLIILTGFLISACSFLNCQQQEQVEAQKAADFLVKTTLVFETGSTPGTRIELSEISRTTLDGHLVVTYGVHVNGAPEDATYTVLDWPVNRAEPRVLAPQAYIAADGQLCVAASQQSGPCKSPIQIRIQPVKGEPLRFMIVSEDQKTRVVTLTVPDPVTGEDRGCSLEAIRLTTKFEAALIRGKGFKPNEKVKYVSNSAGEVVHSTAAIGANGELLMLMEPAVKNKTTGTDRIEFKASNCSPVISFKWGTTEE